MPRFVRNLFTGELEEREFETESGRVLLYKEDTGSMPTKTRGSAWSRAWESQAAAIHPSQVAEFNAAAKKHGTGAQYKPDGTLVCETRGARRKELIRRNLFDGDAGYGDPAPQNSEFFPRVPE